MNPLVPSPKMTVDSLVQDTLEYTSVVYCSGQNRGPTMILKLYLGICKKCLLRRDSEGLCVSCYQGRRYARLLVDDFYYESRDAAVCLYISQVTSSGPRRIETPASTKTPLH